MHLKIPDVNRIDSNDKKMSMPPGGIKQQVIKCQTDIHFSVLLTERLVSALPDSAWLTGLESSQTSLSANSTSSSFLPHRRRGTASCYKHHPSPQHTALRVGEGEEGRSRHRISHPASQGEGGRKNLWPGRRLAPLGNP